MACRLRAQGTGHRAAIEVGLSDKHDNGVGAIFARTAGGKRLSGAGLTVLFEGTSLHQLGAAAHALRCEHNPRDTVTHIVGRNINYTNMCVYRCRFRAFYHKPRDADAYVLPFEVIAKKVEETIATGGTGILLQGGVHPNLRLPFYEGLLRQLKVSFPSVYVHAFSAPEIHFIAKAEKLPLPEVIVRLREAGLESIPGGGQPPADGVPANPSVASRLHVPGDAGTLSR